MRVVDINRIGVPAADAATLPGTTPDEIWAIDPSDRQAAAMRRPDERFAAMPAGVRRHLVVWPGEIAELERRVARHREAGGPGAVRLCPGPREHDYPLEPWVLSPLPEYCASEQVAVTVDPGVSEGAYPWADVVRLARDHPRLVVVALAAPLGGPTAARALDAAPNLILETSGLSDEAKADVRRLVETAGAHRLAYGSGDRVLPVTALASCLTEDERAAVLGGNAELIDRGGWAEAYL